MKTICINISIFIISITITFFLSESLLRLKNMDMKNYNIEMWRYAKKLKQKSDNPVIGHEHIPSSKAVLQSVNFRINSYGMRGGDIPLISKKSRRILFLGASVTFGWGVPEEKTMTVLIDNALGDDVEVLNAGVGNFNTVRYVELFLSKLYKLKPTDIVIHYYMRDAMDLEDSGGNIFLRNSELAVMIWELINKYSTDNSSASNIDFYHKLYTQLSVLDSPHITIDL